MIRPQQIRAARALLGLSQRELAKIADVAISTVKRIEAAGDLTGSARTLWSLQTSLEQAGVVFISGDEGGGPGVRLREGAVKRTYSKRGQRKRS